MFNLPTSEKLATAYGTEIAAALDAAQPIAPEQADMLRAMLGCGLGLDTDGRIRILGAVGHALPVLIREMDEHGSALRDARDFERSRAVKARHVAIWNVLETVPAAGRFLGI